VEGTGLSGGAGEEEVISNHRKTTAAPPQPTKKKHSTSRVGTKKEFSRKGAKESAD
jgi:hypothetical protein